jgi:teichoic acid transport system ATP-binding protein
VAEQTVPPATGGLSLVVDHVRVDYRTFGSRSRRGIRRHVGAVERVTAVHDVSFTAHHGEAIGVVGHNGSGKSTLLRAIAGLVPLSRGAVHADGTASLLGIGGALVKDLSGEANIRLGCLALGLSPAEADARHDAIAAFADLGADLRLPMNALSSGQDARLRFAISTAVRPEILLVDEALSTGDAAFKARSRARLDAIREEAGTVLVVSHSTSTLRQTCTRALWMHRGRLRADGPVDDVLAAYTEDSHSRTSV